MVAVSLKKIFFKQKTAYEIHRGDWSSDVCSSDLAVADVISVATAGKVKVHITPEMLKPGLRSSRCPLRPVGQRK